MAGLESESSSSLSLGLSVSSLASVLGMGLFNN